MSAYGWLLLVGVSAYDWLLLVGVCAYDWPLLVGVSDYSAVYKGLMDSGKFSVTETFGKKSSGVFCDTELQCSR